MCLTQVSSLSVIRSARQRKKFEFESIPTFAPEHFMRVRQKDTLKRKQFVKGTTQIAQEGCDTDIP